MYKFIMPVLGQGRREFIILENNPLKMKATIGITLDFHH